MHPVIHLILQVVSHHHTLLYASTVQLPNAVGLVVYRSTMTRDTDLIYKPVAELLASQPHTILWRENVQDQDMFMAQAEYTIYQFGDADADSSA